MNLCSCSSNNPTPGPHFDQLHSCLQMTHFGLTCRFARNRMLSNLDELSIMKYFLPVALLYSKGKLFSPPECFQGTVQCLMCWGGDDVWVKQGHFVQYFGSSRIRSIMPDMALHNIKVPVASETSPHLPSSPVSFSCFCLLPHFHGPRGDVCMLTRDLGFHREILCCPEAPKDASLPVSWSLCHTWESWAKDRIFCQECVPMCGNKERLTYEIVFVLSSVFISGAGTSYTFIPRSKLGVSNSSLNVLVHNLIYNRW